MPLPVVLSMAVSLAPPVGSLSDLQPADSDLHSQSDDEVPSARLHSHHRLRSDSDGPGEKAATQGVARGLLVTPWFAAAAGFVIAAGMWIISPHADLISASPVIGTSTAGTGGNGTVADKGAGRDQPVPDGGSASSGASTGKTGSGSGRTSAAPATVHYYGHTWPSGRFSVLITLPESVAGKHWAVHFQLAGDQDIQARFASWKASGQAAGTATELTPEPGSSQDNSQPGHPGSQLPAGVNFIVYGTGSGITPTHCTLNGKTCRFAPESIGAG